MLTRPFAMSKKAGTHNKTAGRANNIEINNKTAEIISITLSTSPVKTKKPFINSNPEQNRVM